MTAGTYKGEWSSREDVARDFQITLPDGVNVVYAEYDLSDYEGSAWVVFVRDGRLYEVNASHCSCSGLEGQWEEEETSFAAIRMRPGRESFPQEPQMTTPPPSTPPPSTLRDPDPFGEPPSGDELEAAMKANDDDLTITLALRAAVRYSQAWNMEAATASAALALATAGLDSRCVVTVSARPEHIEPKRFDFKTEFAKFLEQHPMRARR